MQPNYLGVYSPQTISGLLLLTSGSRKNKRTELEDKRLTLCQAKVGEGDKSISATLVKMFGRRVPPSIPSLLSLTLGGRKNKRNELDDRRLTFCYAKVGGT